MQEGDDALALAGSLGWAWTILGTVAYAATGDMPGWVGGSG